ncbi:MAG TPA: prolyl oligopeptidase family serine peptidase [Candidatus Limnocylindrales bacterium]|nr:prolyl oligopeptidase family serine peptidase [Candidatus Limnocylindrales bacterium]
MSGEPVAAPYGSWVSPITLDELYGDRRTPSSLRAIRGALWWQESRPSEDGRDAVVRRAPDGTIADASPAGVNVRTMVHEYGGGAWAVGPDDLLIYADKADGRLYALAPGAEPRALTPAADAPALTPAGDLRYADLEVDAARSRILCVRQDHRRDAQEPQNTLVAVPLAGGEPEVLVEGHDFFSAPRLSPDGRHLAWLSWDHPNLPWDGCQLWLAELDAAGRPREPRVVAGSAGEAIDQPRWSPDGRLHFVAEPDGWWNLFVLGPDEAAIPLAPMAAEFGFPQWNFGRQTYDFLPDGRIVAISARSADDAGDRLWLIGPAPGQVEALANPWTQLSGLAVLGERIGLLCASWTEPPSIVLIDATGQGAELVQRSTAVRVDPADVSIPTAITFPTSDGAVAHGLFYPPRNARFRGPPGERPPVVVRSHGGPTSSAATCLSLAFQYLTSRGIAVVDVDYRGSTGYGRAYRQALEGQWGIYDVDDCVAAVAYLAAEGLVDGERAAIEGGSASGYTTLAALAFRDAFCAGVSYFGIGDLETFVHGTHKFESRYLDRLVGPWPAAAATYRARSPIHHLDQVSCPMLILQGLDDRIVPPTQAEQITAALRARGLPYAYLPFEGEGHGFRREANLRRATQAELAFYGQVLGFTPADTLPPLELERPPA